jgi:tight adherence protein C
VLLLLVLAICCLTMAVLIFGEVVAAPGRERMRSIRLASDYGKRFYAEALTRESFRERVVLPLRQWLGGLVLRLSPKTTVEAVGTRLMRAGMTRRISPIGFLASKAIGAIVGLVGGALLGAVSSGAAGNLLFAVGGAACGYLLPDVFLTLRTRSRRDRIAADLPNALDLLAVSVEAGLGFDAAIAKLTERIDGPLAEEFGLLLQEIRIGESRENALKKLGARTGVPAVASFVRAMVQADQLGMSIGRILRVQATDSRLKRQAAAEERAMKAPVKMLLPTVLFIFPAMFLVILGPAFISLFKLF